MGRLGVQDEGYSARELKEAEYVEIAHRQPVKHIVAKWMGTDEQPTGQERAT